MAVISVLVEGTAYLDMFDAQSHCLFSRAEMLSRFQGWEILHCEHQDFAAPAERVSSFVTLVARKPHQGSPAAAERETLGRPSDQAVRVVERGFRESAAVRTKIGARIEADPFAPRAAQEIYGQI